ncbi:MAG: hypothetical protein EBU22_01535 [Actinobacteria bacterium]|jgi:Mg2+ and Co2+ transporter CorA|nr:hypothetical protein [Actinomycetota bacterium]NCU80579.1 hypothetical protein [Acidimicrobiia bacterium]NDC99293.1 hypothetical protein [bacterium]HBQ51827.1 hypothetical protein [Acidimicrobium sp.]NBO97403.1 hypothetical protein [Actinomycetota bacterium]
MNDNPSLSASLATSDSQIELNKLLIRLQKAEEKVMHLELALMQSRDFAIGSAAQAGEAVANLNKLRHIQEMLDDANIHIKNHQNHIERLETTLSEIERTNAVHRAKSRQLDLVYESASWKIGRFFMLPVRILKRIVR